MADFELHSTAPVAENADRRGRRKWRRFLLIYAVCLLLIGVVGCVVLYNYLDSYEASRPEHVMDALMADTSVDTWCAYVQDDFREALSEFENPDELFSGYFDAVLKNANYTYRRSRSDSSSNDVPVYVVRAGMVELCQVTLAEKESAGFGMYIWEVGSIESCFSMNSLQSVSIEVDAPADQPIFLNGIEIAPEYIIDDKVPCPDMTQLEQGFDEQAYFVRYRVEPLYGSISVTDNEGSTLSALDSSDEHTVSYLLPETDFYSFTITAPSNISVNVGGVTLTSDDITSTAPGVLENLEEYAGDGLFHSVTYELTDLYTQPEITAYDAAGNLLRPVVSGKEANTLTFFHAHDDALYQEAHDEVEEFLSKYMTYSQQKYNYYNYTNLLSCILPDTKLYSYIKNSKDGMYWARATEISYEELTFTDFAPVNDDCFTCTIRYDADFSAQGWYEKYNYDLQNAYEMVFVRSNGEWYA
ncbi:MAG: hypothetical protein IKL27_02815, partial [Oscillospiraceae bacterium]|nr:hypothetical protein [Oscillospiraceae bacterium]